MSVRNIFSGQEDDFDRASERVLDATAAYLADSTPQNMHKLIGRLEAPAPHVTPEQLRRMHRALGYSD